MTRYRGTIIKVGPSSRYAWIGRSTIESKGGAFAPLSLGKDIYLHASDCSCPLEVGLLVLFEVKDDARREDGKRAVRAELDELHPLEVMGRTGIDLHVDSTVIENPSVSMRWCFSSQMHARIISGLRQGNGYAILLRARRASDDEEGFHEIREVKGWNQPFSILTFSRPGDWLVDILLFERGNMDFGEDTSNGLKLAMRDVFLDRAGKSRWYSHSIGSMQDISFTGVQGSRQLRVFRNSTPLFGAAISARTVAVHVPEEVFAKELPRAVTEFANYFYRSRAHDECELRRRLLFMIPGLIPWTMLEGLKRILHVGVSVFFLLACVKGSGRLFLYSFNPEVNFAFMDGLGKHLVLRSNTRMLVFVLARPWDRPVGMSYTPLALLIYSGVIYLLVQIAAPTFGTVASAAAFVARHYIEFGVGVVVVVLLFALSFWFEWNKFSRLERKFKRRHVRREKQAARTLVLAKRDALVAERHAQTLVCGDAPLSVSLKALPQELQTATMWFQSLKRVVCRPFV